MNKENRIALCSKLGLATEASDTTIMDAVATLQDDKQKALNSAQTPSLEKFVPRADHDQVKGELVIAQNRIKEIDEGNVEAMVDDAIKKKDCTCFS